MDKSTKPTTCHCNACRREIPLSSALSPEGMDYVYHFCGGDCFEKWKKIKAESEKDK